MADKLGLSDKFADLIIRKLVPWQDAAKLAAGGVAFPKRADASTVGRTDF